VAECGGLENRYGVTPIVGSNPTPSAGSRIALSDKAILVAPVGLADIYMVSIAAVSETVSGTVGCV
jgi:hypothetical protein